MAARPPLALSLAFFAAFGTASCGGSPKHVGEITPAVAGGLSRIWVLDERQSDDPAEAMAGARPGPEGARPAGGRPQGGARPPAGGGRPGGGDMPGGGPGGGGGPGQGGRGPGSAGNPEAAQALRRLATVVPRRLGISLSDSAVVVTYPHEEPWLLPFGEGVKRELGEGVEVDASAEWKDGLLSVTRKVSGAGSLKETFHPSSNGERLAVAVEITMGQRGGAQFRRVYQPEGATQGAPPR